MKSGRRSFPRSARASRRRVSGNANRMHTESKCLACGQSVDAVLDQAAERHESALPCSPVHADAIDMEKFLHFSQQLYAHALTLQEVLRKDGEATYEALRARYDRQAAQQFEVFFHTFQRSSERRPRVGHE